MSNPRSPSIIGSVLLSATARNAYDVKLKGNVAFAGFGDRAMTVNLTDPTKPATARKNRRLRRPHGHGDTGGIFSVNMLAGFGIHVTSLQPPKSRS